MLILVSMGIMLIPRALSLEKETHKDLFQLVALVITLSSATFVSNAMAGFMLRDIQRFRLGDFRIILHSWFEPFDVAQALTAFLILSSRAESD